MFHGGKMVATKIFIITKRNKQKMRSNLARFFYSFFHQECPCEALQRPKNESLGALGMVGYKMPLIGIVGEFKTML